MAFTPEQIAMITSAEQFAERSKQHVADHLTKVIRVQEVNNRLLRCSIECPIFDRPEDCKECVKAQKTQCLKAWNDKKKLEMELNIK